MPELTKELPLSESKKMKLFSPEYFRQAAESFKSVKMLAFASLIVAMRVAVKFANIPLAAGLELSLDCYVNSLGAVVYGPLMGLLVGAVSDTLGCIIHPTGPYFFPFIFTEMSSSFIFALFLWRRKLSCPRILASKFTVNLVCNIILTSALMKPYMSIFYGKGYNFINLTRIVKNLVTFPVEAIVITLILGALIKPLKSLGLLTSEQENIPLKKKDIIITCLLTAFSVCLVLFYIFFLKDFISAHNIKLL